jgi:hypothetical protein
LAFQEAELALMGADSGNINTSGRLPLSGVVLIISPQSAVNILIAEQVQKQKVALS